MVRGEVMRGRVCGGVGGCDGLDGPSGLGGLGDSVESRGGCGVVWCGVVGGGLLDGCVGGWWCPCLHTTFLCGHAVVNCLPE